MCGRVGIARALLKERQPPNDEARRVRRRRMVSRCAPGSSSASGGVEAAHLLHGSEAAPQRHLEGNLVRTSPSMAVSARMSFSAGHCLVLACWPASAAERTDPLRVATARPSMQPTVGAQWMDRRPARSSLAQPDLHCINGRRGAIIRPVALMACGPRAMAERRVRGWTWGVRPGDAGGDRRRRVQVSRGHAPYVQRHAGGR